MLFNSLSRRSEEFRPIHPAEARVYSCGPTVYNYQHLGNMRAYVFADTLGRTLSSMGYKLTHIINITDVGHLTSDADAGDDKMEKAAASAGKSALEVAAFYQADFEADLARLNVRRPVHPRATEYVPSMIDFAKAIADKHCYELDSGLYFDVSTVADYGRLARAATDDGKGRIEAVESKRHAADFAIWRKTPADESRQMEWDSPWGKGAPGWHLECSVMSGQLLGFPFDIHTGGIDHREIHHPNEIAQNQAFCCTNGLDVAANSGARIWMHNNFLVERSGKMSKSSGEFLRLQLLIDKGYHPLAYRLMCLQAHYRSELEFSWDGLGAALTRLKRLVMAAEKLGDHRAATEQFLPRQGRVARSYYDRLDAAIADDLNTPLALVALEEMLSDKRIGTKEKADMVATFDGVLGLGLTSFARAGLRIRPASVAIAETEVEAALASRQEARAAKDFAKSDALREELALSGVEVMDGDPLGWEWKLGN